MECLSFLFNSWGIYLSISQVNTCKPQGMGFLIGGLVVPHPTTTTTTNYPPPPPSDTHLCLDQSLSPPQLRSVPKNLREKNSITSILTTFRLKTCVKKLYFILKKPKIDQFVSWDFFSFCGKFSYIPPYGIIPDKDWMFLVPSHQILWEKTLDHQD